MSQIVEEHSSTGQRFAAELIGTFAVVLLGAAGAVMSSGDALVTALAFGLSYAVMGYAVGRVSGGHFNPAVTLATVLSGRLPWSATPVYLGAQLLGGLLGGAVLVGLLQGFPGFVAEGNIGANFFGEHGGSNGYAWWAALLLEALLTALVVWVLLGVTDGRNGVHLAMAPLVVGLAYTVVHLASSAATGTSVNPARSIGVAVFAGSDALVALWVFVLAPLLGGTIAGMAYPLVLGRDTEPVPGSGFKPSGVRRRKQVAGYPAGYGQWQQPGAPWQQPGPPAAPWGQDPYAAQPQQQWGPPPGEGYDQQWQEPQGYPGPHPSAQTQQRPGRHPQQGPGQWGRPNDDDDEDGRTQIRRPD